VKDELKRVAVTGEGGGGRVRQRKKTEGKKLTRRSGKKRGVAKTESLFHAKRGLSPGDPVQGEGSKDRKRCAFPLS